MMNCALDSRALNDDARVARLINCALQERPLHSHAWSVRTMAEAEGMSSTPVHRGFKRFGFKPHLTRIFKLFQASFFIE